MLDVMAVAGSKGSCPSQASAFMDRKNTSMYTSLLLYIYIMTIHRQCIFTIYCRICMIARTFEFVHLIFQVRMINHVQCSGFYPSFN